MGNRGRHHTHLTQLRGNTCTFILMYLFLRYRLPADNDGDANYLDESNEASLWRQMYLPEKDKNRMGRQTLENS
jgi:hypothetical protein